MTGFGSFFRQLLKDMTTQKLRTFLTAFGIIWGTVAVSLLLAFGEGLHRNQTKSMAGLGDRIVIAWPSRTSMPYEGLGRGRRIPMTEEDVDFLKAKVQGITGISSEYSGDFIACYGDRKRSVSVSGVAPVFGLMRNMIPVEGGRFINPIDMRERRRVVFVGDRVAEDLFSGEDGVGKEILLHGSPFTVIGVLKPKEQDSNYSGRDSGKMVIPSTTFRAITGEKIIDLFIYKAASPDLNKALTAEVMSALSQRLRFHPDDDQAIQIWDTTEMFVFFDAFMLGFKIFLGIMGVLTLIVGGIGVSNIMNVVVEERTREIGIKMALGAKGRTILGQFVLETMLLTAVSGAIGLGISWAICRAVPVLGFTEFVGDPTLSPPLAVLTASVLGVIGLLVGYFPARDASNLDPVIAMKL
jgi:putative ABC transport system permease protein